MKNPNVLLCTVVLFVAMTLREADGRKMEMDEIRKALKGVRKTCQPKFNVPKEIVDAAGKGQFEDDKRLYCYQHCVLVMIKAIRNDVLREDVMNNQADLMLFDNDAERVKAVIRKCVPLANKEDGCKIAWVFSKCFYEMDPEVYFLP